MMASGKVDRKRLPRPTHRLSLAGDGSYTAPATAAEEALAEQLGAVLGLEKVSTDAHFFNDLGADSLLMAHYLRPHQEGNRPAAGGHAGHL